MFAKLWLNTLERYVSIQEMGLPGLALRYEDIQAAPQETLHKIFEYCGLPVTRMDAVYQVLEKDSQAGSGFARDALRHKQTSLTESQRADLFQELQAHPVIQSPDFLVPGTWIPAERVR
jgi:hypothetical protein